MKRLFILFLPLFALSFVSCSKTPQQDEAHLHGVRGEWTNAQTERAIELYLNTLHQESAALDRALQLQDQAAFFETGKCSRAVLRTRQGEIDNVRAQIRAKRARLK